jgi:hypothetical protein
MSRGLQRRSWQNWRVEIGGGDLCRANGVKKTGLNHADNVGQVQIWDIAGEQG